MTRPISPHRRAHLEPGLMLSIAGFVYFIWSAENNEILSRKGQSPWKAATLGRGGENAHGPQLRGSGSISRWHPCHLSAPLSYWWAPTVFERVPDLMQVIGEMCLLSSFLRQLKESFLLLCICRLPLGSRIIEQKGQFIYFNVSGFTI